MFQNFKINLWCRPFAVQFKAKTITIQHICDGFCGHFGAGRFSIFVCELTQHLYTFEFSLFRKFSYLFFFFNFSFTVELVVAALPDIYAERTLEFVSKQITASHHIEFYLNWSTNLLTIHTAKENVFKNQSLLATQDALTRKYEALSKVCDFNKYTLKVLIEMADATEATENTNGAGENDDDEDMESDSDESNLMLIRRTNDVENDLAASDEVMSDDSDQDLIKFRCKKIDIKKNI